MLSTMKIKQRSLCFIYKIFKLFKTFKFQGRKYRYFCHYYNNTWANERVVEVPIVLEIVKKHHQGKILEIGNVLSNYFFINNMDVLDKYDGSKGVIKQDVVNFKPGDKYDLIVSISTLEHVGWDENPKDSHKILRAIGNLKNCLSHGGKMVITLPLGYNPCMDKLIKERKIKFDEQYYLKRISKDNRWEEAEYGDVHNAKYGKPFPRANALLVGIEYNS